MIVKGSFSLVIDIYNLNDSLYDEGNITKVVPMTMTFKVNDSETKTIVSVLTTFDRYVKENKK